ncbi:MAG: hypothetical protein KKH32_00485, partial [Bacteroidetes bacterium]|nr:hypothetical protein [Bacteroidota bacterium]
ANIGWFSSIPTETNSRCGSGCIEKTMKNFVVVASFLLFTWFCVTSVSYNAKFLKYSCFINCKKFMHLND